MSKIICRDVKIALRAQRGPPKWGCSLLASLRKSGKNLHFFSKSAPSVRRTGNLYVSILADRIHAQARSNVVPVLGTRRGRFAFYSTIRSQHRTSPSRPILGIKSLDEAHNSEARPRTPEHPDSPGRHPLLLSPGRDNPGAHAIKARYSRYPASRSRCRDFAQ
jgi:hypothetical protein